jgi:hypothetical protein
MELKMGDTIYVKGFKDENPEFYCWKHMKDLIGFPTRVFLIRNDTIYVTHPTLDVVPFSEDCVDYEVIEGVNLGHHRDLKNKQNFVKKMGMNKVPQKNIGKIFKNLNEVEEKKELTNTQKKLLTILKKFESEDIDKIYIENSIGGIDKFLNLLEKQNLMGYIDPLETVWDEFENLLLYKKIELDPSYIWTVVNSLSDIVKIGDTYYFDTSGEELSDFFNTGRNDISRESIEEIIEGNYEFGSWDVTNDEYRDVYEQLKPENKKLVDVRIREELTKKGALDIESKLLEKIGLEQGRGYVTLDDNIITRILEDDETMRYVINRELDDVRSDLYSIYSSCYSDILTDNWYGDIMSELVGEVIDNTTFEEYSFKKNVYNNRTGKSEQRTVYARRYPVTNCVFSLVKDWIYEYKDSTWNDDSINYHGSYYNLMKAAMNSGLRSELRVPHLDDYADYYQVSRCVNENIGDYF